MQCDYIKLIVLLVYVSINIYKYMFLADVGENDCNWTQTQNHLVCKQTLNHLTKL